MKAKRQAEVVLNSVTIVDGFWGHISRVRKKLKKHPRPPHLPQPRSGSRM